MPFAPPIKIDQLFAERYVRYFEEQDSALEDYSTRIMDLEIDPAQSEALLIAVMVSLILYIIISL